LEASTIMATVDLKDLGQHLGSLYDSLPQEPLPEQHRDLLLEFAVAEAVAI
jgi:hypothetical protein